LVGKYKEKSRVEESYKERSEEIKMGKGKRKDFLKDGLWQQRP
jgi:hypothetical protein